jgi:hypothetical protein
MEMNLRRTQLTVRLRVNPMPSFCHLRLDDSEVPGLPSTIGYIGLLKTDVSSVASLVLEKLRWIP